MGGCGGGPSVCLLGVWTVSDELDLLFRRMLCKCLVKPAPATKLLSLRSAINSAQAFKAALKREIR